MEKPATANAAWEREHQIFWMLLKGVHDQPVGRLYLAIQAALAFGQERVDAGWLMGAMMAKGRATIEATQECIGGAGLACFAWLFEVELIELGATDCHVYHFRRRRDGKQTLATLRTSDEPRSLQFQQTYERERRRLEKQREVLLTRLQSRRASGVENVW